MISKVDKKLLTQLLASTVIVTLGYGLTFILFMATLFTESVIFGTMTIIVFMALLYTNHYATEKYKELKGD